jgi:hypothetical protein
MISILVKNLIGEFNELENQSIFFAAPESLNDPTAYLFDTNHCIYLMNGWGTSVNI